MTHEERNPNLYSIDSRKQELLAKAVTFLAIQTLYFIFCFQNVQTQEVTDRDISELAQRLARIESQLVSIDQELSVLRQNYDTVTSEKNRLTRELMQEETESKGLVDRFRGVFGYRKRSKRAKLMAESRELADKISNIANNRREPLVKQFVTLADELVDKSSFRMTALMEVVNQANLSNDFATRNAAWGQVSNLWKLAEETLAAKKKYAPEAPGPEQTGDLPSLLGDDPDELRFGAAILKDWAKAARSEVARLEGEIENLQRRVLLMKRMVEVSERMQRSDEERGATGVGAAQMPWRGDERSSIADTQREIDRLMELKRKYEADAERFDSQSNALEKRASQIDTELRGG